MIFKTLLTDLSKVTAVVTNLKEVSALVNGASGLLNKDSVNGLSSAIKGLNIQQAQLALSFKHLTQEQMNQVLVQAGLIASEDKIQAELLQTALAQSALSEEQKKSILTKLKLINAETGEILVDKSCTKEKLLEVLATKGITGAKADEIVTTLGLTGSNAGLAISYEVVRKAASRFFGTLLKNPLTWVIAGITAAGVVLYKVAKVSDEVAEKAQNLGEEFNSSSTSITDFKKRIDELHAVINDSNSSVEEVKEARVNLLSVQDEIIDKFGDEKEVIDVVTDAINNQSDALNNLTQKEWTDSLNDFNKEGFWNSIGNWINGYDSNAERMLDTYGDYSISLDLFDFSYGYTNEEYNKFIETLKKDFGADVSSSLGMATFTGNASEVHEILLGIQGIAKDFEFSDKFNKQLTKAANAAKDVSNKYKDMYNQYILYEEVLPNYKDQYKELTDAYSDYKEAWTSGDVDAQNKAIEVISNALQNASTNIDNKYVVDFFENMYPELQSVIDKWEFKAKIIPMVDTKPLQGKTDADILEMLTTDNLQDGESTFNYIVNRALENKIIPDTSQESIQTVIDLLIELGVVERTIVNNTKDVTTTFSDIFALEDAKGKLTPLGEANKAVNDLQAAYTGLKETMDSYNATGHFTVDQVQDIISYGGEYLKYLMDEEGNLQLNEDALNRVAVARLNEMRIKALSSLYDELNKITDETSAQSYLETQLYETSDAYKDLTASKIEDWKASVLTSDMTEETKTAVINSFKNQAAAINEMFDNIDIGSMFGSGSSTSPSDILDKEITALEKAAEAGTITYKEYLSERERLVNDYYNRGLIKAEEYYAELEELAQAQVDYYEKVLAAIERTFDREIDAIQDTIDGLEKKNKLLEKQKEKYDSALDAIQDFLDAEKDKLDDQIDGINKENYAIQEQIDKYDQLLNAVTLVFDEKREAIQSEIDVIDDRIEALQKENDEYQKQLDLEKAKDALLKARNQRTKYLYAGEGKGFIYQADSDAIADAEQTLSDLTFQSTIDALEKEKELLTDIIEKLDESEQKWQDIADAFDNQQAKDTAKDLLGDDYTDVILGADPDVIAGIMNQYVNSEQKIEDNNSLIESIEEKKEHLDSLSEKWSEISSAYQTGLNNQNAALLLGNAWQSIILADRQVDYDNFKNAYLDIQAQIDSNQSLIDSYNEKIVYYEDLKKQWQDIADVYQDSVNDQILAQEFGRDEELPILLAREENIENFRKAYVKAQEAMSKAAWDSARAQVEAAKYAKTNGGSGGDKGDDGGDKQPTASYRVVNSKGQVVASGFTSENEASRYIENAPKNNPNNRNLKIEKYHGGLDEGYVGSQFRPLSDDERLNLLRKASIDGLKSNEVPAILQEGELVLTKDQIKGITNSLVAPNYYSGLMNGLSSLPQGIQNRETNITQHISITLPNITNTGGYENFVRAMNQLSNDALQFSKRN